VFSKKEIMVKVVEMLLRALFRVDVKLTRGEDTWWLASVSGQALNARTEPNLGDGTMVSGNWRLADVTFGTAGEIGFELRPNDNRAHLLPALRVQARLNSLEIGLDGASMHLTIEAIDAPEQAAPVAAALGVLARLFALSLFEAGWLSQLPPSVRHSGREVVITLAPGLLSPLYEQTIGEHLPATAMDRLPGALRLLIEPALRPLLGKRGIEVMEFGSGRIAEGSLVLPLRLREQPK
jgi:hypothetical protein